MSTLKVNAIQTTGGVEMYLCKAWVNFNGTGTVAIRASGNVSSITDNGVGSYTVNLISSMPDLNFAPLSNMAGTDGVSWGGGAETGVVTTSTYVIKTVNAGGTATFDTANVFSAIFR